MQQPLRPPEQRVATAQPLAALPLTDAACPLRASGTRGKRSWSNAFLHPDEVGTIRHGTAVSTSQKTIACPKVRPNRSRHRYVDPRTATLHACAKLRPKRSFLLDRARPVFFSTRWKRKWGVHPRWTSPLREQTPPWPPFGGPSEPYTAERQAAPVQPARHPTARYSLIFLYNT